MVHAPYELLLLLLLLLSLLLPVERAQWHRQWTTKTILRGIVSVKIHACKDEIAS